LEPSGTGIALIGPANNVDLAFRTNATERMRITSGGNVLIGTNSDNGARLQVSGSGVAFSFVTSNGLIGNINSNAANGGYITWQTSGTTIADIGTSQQIFGSGGNDTFGINGRGARALAFGTNNTERMRITSGGDVGIGTISPSIQAGFKQLSISAGVSGNVRGALNIQGARTADSTFASLAFYHKTNYVAGIESSRGGADNSGSLEFYTSNTGTLAERMRITSGGNVGIGTNSPVTYGTRNLDVNAGSGGSAYIVARANSNAGTVELAFDTDAGYLSTKSNHPLIVRTNDVERMRITSGGLVGINTNNPFNFGSESGMIDVRSQNTSAVCGVFISNSNRSASIVNYINNAAGGFIGTSTNHYLDIGTNDVGRLRITSGGSVGIGTTTINDKLEVRGADNGITISSIVANRPALSLVNGTTTMLKLSANGTYGAIGDGTSADRYMSFNAGSVGIGTTSPTEKLHVDSGNVYINGEASGLIVDAQGEKRIGFMKYGGHEAVISRIAGQDFGIVRVGTSDIKDVTGITYDVYVGSSGNVGIGTSSPGTLFHVNGSGTIGRFQSSISYVDLSFINSTSSNGFIQYNGNNFNFFANSGSTPTMTITGGSPGNVLIGTTTDIGSRLRVNGVGYFDESIFSGNQGLNVGGYNFYSQTISGAMGILGHNLRASASVANQVNVVNSGWYSSMIKMYYSEGITFHTSTTSYSAGDVYPMAGTERMRIAFNGRIGMGTNDPIDQLHVAGGITSTGLSNPTTTSVGSLQIGYDGTTGVIRTWNSSPLLFSNYNHQTFETSGSIRMRITSGGNILMGTTTDAGYTLNVAGNAQFIKSSTSTAMVVGLSGVTGSIIRFSYNGSFVGSISTDGTDTAYNTSSDYRLKQDIKDFNGLDLLSRIKPYDFEWKSDKTRSYGVLAHELQEVINYAVTGSKDAEDMQGVDYSKLVPILIKAIQELNEKIR